jgi:hypothetical protein
MMIQPSNQLWQVLALKAANTSRDAISADLVAKVAVLMAAAVPPANPIGA